MNYQWGHNRRFNSYSEYFRQVFGQRVQKLSIDAGFSCPNRDGTISTGGCTFCNANAFNPSYCQPFKSITQQISEGIEFHATRYRRASQYLAYFQPYTNTHTSLDKLKRLFEEALEYPEVIGLVIGTRPDCVDDAKLDYIATLAKKYYVIVEYGIESCYNHTLKRINRGHNFEQTKDALIRTSERGIKTGGHLIFGLPGESYNDMMNEAQIISNLPLTTIKFHQLQIVNDTLMAKEFKQKPDDFHLFELNEYLNLIMRFLEQLSPEIVVERIASEVPPHFLVEPPKWDLRYDQVLNVLEKKMAEADSWQGKFFKK